MKKLITEDRFLKACGDRDEEDMRIVKLYILEGSDINITNSENKTGLYLAIEAGNFRIAEMLLETNNVKAPQPFMGWGFLYQTDANRNISYGKYVIWHL